MLLIPEINIKPDDDQPRTSTTTPRIPQLLTTTLRLSPARGASGTEAAAQPRDVAVRRGAEQLLVVAAEVRGVTVADAVARARRIQLFSEHQAARLPAIREVTALPVTTLVYSHFHVDHVGDAQFWVDEAPKAGIHLRLVATKATAEKMAFMQSRLPNRGLFSRT